MNRFRLQPSYCGEAYGSYNGGLNIVSYGFGTKPTATTTISMLALVFPPKRGTQNNGFVFSRCPTSTSNGLRLNLADSGAGPGWGVGFNSTGTAGSPQCAAAANTTVYGQWQHFACSWDGTLTASSAITMYQGINGQVLGDPLTHSTNTNGTTAAANNSGDNFVIGDRDGGTRNYDGYVAYIALWSRVLLQNEFRHAQINGPLSKRPGLFFLWSCGRDYGPYHLHPTSFGTGAPNYGGAPRL